MLSNRQNFESWHEAGGLDAARRANGIWKQLLADYQRPPMDPAIEEALTDYVARRKGEAS
jgi:trimethylamine--corrinoid protein Co-methyltransferase